MIELQTILEKIPPMLSGKALTEAMTVLPAYDESIRSKNTSMRLMALSDLHTLYIPSAMSHEIYSKLYLALLRSLQKKCTQAAIKQRYENHKAIQQQEYRGIMGGADSFTIIGTSGIGKSSAISRAISMITANRVIELDKPQTKIIPCLIVQCPFDCSVKGLLLEILRKVDEELDSDYYLSALKSRAATTDMLIGSVSTIALNHIGLLVVDEVQNVVNSKNGRNLIGVLTQLINNSGISICMVGTPESAVFFEGAMQLARRSLGLCYTDTPFDEHFARFCEIVYRYQYVQKRAFISSAITEWLYEHSSGVISIVLTLIHDAQEIAILSGTESLDMVSLNEAYSKRLALLHAYVAPAKTHRKSVPSKKKSSTLPIGQAASPEDHISIAALIQIAKEENVDLVELLRQHFVVTEVRV